MKEYPEISWNGGGALATISGPSSSASPVRAMFLVHRVAASGRLWMTRGLTLQSIDFTDGKIVGCSGFVELVEGVDGDRQYSVLDWVRALESSTASEVSPTAVIARSLCQAAVRVAKDGDWMVNFVAGESDAEAVPIPESTAEVLLATLREGADVEATQSWLEDATALGFVVCEPTDSEPDVWGLNNAERSLLSSVGRDGSVGAVFVAVGPEGWISLSVLRALGLVDAGSEATNEAEDEPAVEVEEPEDRVQDEPAGSGRPDAETESEESSSPQPERRRGDRRSAGTNRDVPTRPKEERRKGERRAHRSGDDRGRDGRRRRLDPKRAALRRAPHESSPDMIEPHLREAYEVLKSASPEFLFQLRKEEHLKRDIIEQRYRKVVTRYHPDRYRNHSQAVKALAEGCFTAVSDAFHRSQDEAYLADLRIRIIEKQTGKKVVTDKTRATAKVDFAKAEALFKQKRFEAAHALAARAQEGDPDRWQYAYLWYRTGYRCGALGIDDVEVGILGLQGMTTIEKADQLYTLGEILLKENNETKAYKLFHQAVSLDEKNVGANRRLRLRSRRLKDEEKASSGGLFGGLFRGKDR